MARPKRQFDAEIMQKMERMALDGCQNGTISNALDIPNTTLVRRFGKLLTKKRCERKANLRANQTELSKTNPAMAIFLGKNELGQQDKQTVEHEQTKAQAYTAEEQAILREAGQRLTLLRLNKDVQGQGQTERSSA